MSCLATALHGFVESGLPAVKPLGLYEVKPWAALGWLVAVLSGCLYLSVAFRANFYQLIVSGINRESLRVDSERLRVYNPSRDWLVAGETLLHCHCSLITDNPLSMFVMGMRLKLAADSPAALYSPGLIGGVAPKTILT